MNLFEEIVSKANRIKVRAFEKNLGVVEECDRVVGVLDSNLQKLYAVRIGLHEVLLRALKACTVFIEAHKDEQSEPPGFRELKRKHALAECRYKGVDELFWSAVRTTFPELLGKASIGIRAGWKVVWTEGPVLEIHIAVQPQAVSNPKPSLN